MANTECVFCAVNGLLEGEVIATTDRAYLVKNIRVGVPDAYLIIPIDHIEDGLPDWWQEEINTLLPSIPGWEPDTSYNLCTNFGYDAGQRLPHLHTHAILRTPDQGQVGLGTFIRERTESSGE
jgi:diadenosine tetraphosphate (Ap4A) HIT family hydrolase